MVRYTFTTWAAPFYNAIFVLFILTGINGFISKVFKRTLFNSLEMLCIYSMVSVASAIISTDLVGILITMMGYPAHFADATNQWDTIFKGALPEWLLVTDKESLRGFYEGNTTIYNWANLKPWLRPSLNWSIFIAALFGAFTCLSTLLRKQWVDSERLTFPIVQLPVAMTDESVPFYRDKLMWIGFAIAGGITLMNGFHELNPNVPYIPIKRENFEPFSVPPFNVIGAIRISFYFFAIALGFIMPLDLGVSIWFFFFVYLGQMIVSQGMGYPPHETLHFSDQAWGGYMTIALFVLWGTRRHVATAFRTAFLGGDKSYDQDEPARYRTVFIWLAICLAVMIGFLIAAGMSWYITIAWVFVIICLAVIISRIRAELGFPVHDLNGAGPHDVFPRLIGAQNVSKTTVGALVMMYWADRIFRSHPMPHEMEALKMSGVGRTSRQMLRAVIIAGLFAIPVCFWVYLDGFYALGASTSKVGPWALGYGQSMFPRLEYFMTTPDLKPDGSWWAVLAGVLITGSMMFARTRIIGFPLHPLGFAVANSWGVWQLWLPILIGSTAKAIVLKTGGLKNYRKALMFFFGLMLGEFIVGCSWTLFGLAAGIRTYDFWP